MSLDYGWAWCRGAGSNEHVPSPESDRLNASEHKDFLLVLYHQVLPFVSLYVGIPHITEESLPLFTWRWRMRDLAGSPIYPTLASEMAKRGLTLEETMSYFVGYSTNASWKTDTEFWKEVRGDSRASQMILTDALKKQVFREVDRLREVRRACAAAT